MAEMKLGIGYRKDSRQAIPMADGSRAGLTITEIASSPRTPHSTRQT